MPHLHTDCIRGASVARIGTTGLQDDLTFVLSRRVVSPTGGLMRHLMYRRTSRGWRRATSRSGTASLGIPVLATRVAWVRSARRGLWGATVPGRARTVPPLGNRGRVRTRVDVRGWSASEVHGTSAWLAVPLRDINRNPPVPARLLTGIRRRWRRSPGTTRALCRAQWWTLRIVHHDRARACIRRGRRRR